MTSAEVVRTLGARQARPPVTAAVGAPRPPLALAPRKRGVTPAAKVTPASGGAKVTPASGGAKVAKADQAKAWRTLKGALREGESLADYIGRGLPRVTNRLSRLNAQLSKAQSASRSLSRKARARRTPQDREQLDKLTRQIKDLRASIGASVKERDQIKTLRVLDRERHNPQLAKTKQWREKFMDGNRMWASRVLDGYYTWNHVGKSGQRRSGPTTDAAVKHLGAARGTRRVLPHVMALDRKPDRTVVPAVLARAMSRAQRQKGLWIRKRHGLTAQETNKESLELKAKLTSPQAPVIYSFQKGKRQTDVAQFFALEHPGDPGYVKKMGLNPRDFDPVNGYVVVIRGPLPPKIPFVTGHATSYGGRSGGQPEVVLPPLKELRGMLSDADYKRIVQVMPYSAFLQAHPWPAPSTGQKPAAGAGGGGGGGGG